VTPEQHNRYLSWAHFIHAGLSSLMMVGMFVIFTAVMAVDPNPPPFFFFIFMGFFMILIFGLMIVPSFVAGYGLKRRKRWARTASIIAGVTASMSAPVGIAVCIYTFWFLFSDPGKLLYDNARHALPPRNEAWRIPSREVREHQYVPPSSPPDWR
jgi:hypothetical protein